MRESRPHSPALDAILGDCIPILDHGFIRVIDYMGDDAAIVQAARVSYGAGTKSVSDDTALIRYLMRHRHTSPLEQCEIKFHCRMPIFVARQWIRHRTASLNEESARYSEMKPEFYIPPPEQLARQSSANRQGREAQLTTEDAAAVLRILYADAQRSYDDYVVLLRDYDLSRELARINLPLGSYTEMYWKIDLHNLFHFLSLRVEPHAQWEIRQYAEAMLGVVRKWCPIATQAFEDYRLNAVTFSAQAMAALKRMMAGAVVTQEDSGMGKREYAEFLAALGETT